MIDRGAYVGYVVVWLVVCVGIFMGRRVGALPFPYLTFPIFVALYCFGALWIIRQRHERSTLFARIAKVVLLTTGILVIIYALLPDSYPFSFATKPRWYDHMINALFFLGVGASPLLLLVGWLLPAAMHR